MITRETAQKAVKKHGGKSQAARALGVTRNVLRSALDRPPVKAARKPDPAKALAAAEAKVDALTTALRAERARRAAPPVKVRKGKASKTCVRVVIPDSHGAHIDWPAAKAMIADLSVLCPDEVVLIGDHLDCGGTFSTHQRNYTHEMTESYADDVREANRFLDLVGQYAPNARKHYLEGNHEQHVERWAARNFQSFADAKFALEVLGPEAVLGIKARGISYYRMSEQHMGLTTPGMIKLGKCFYAHGWKFSTHATAAMLRDVGGNLVHGHTHRAQSDLTSTTTSHMHGGWCGGTLAKKQMLYMHTKPSTWTHGYIVQFVNEGTGTFMTMHVPIFGDRTLLLDTVNGIAERRVA